MPEINYKEIAPRILVNTAIAATLISITGWAFSKRSVILIKKRYNNTCAHEGSGHCKGNLECAHINHDQDDPKYDDPENGILLCTEHHYWDHVDRPLKNIGLSRTGNKHALGHLIHRLRNL